jgi:hypothetical protein
MELQEPEKGLFELPPTAPENYNIRLDGFESKELAEAFGQLLGFHVHCISRVINLSRLDGITVAYDFEGALKTLDRGFPSTLTLAPTSDFAQGVAMTPAVKRDGIAKAHMVFNAAHVRPLEDQQSTLWREAFYMVGHECAHVQLLMDTDDSFPGAMFTDPFKTDFERFQHSISSPCWDEYVASRLSASFCEEHVKYYEETFLTVLAGIKERTAKHREAYFQTKDHTSLAYALKTEYTRLLKYTSYLVGHLSGLDGDFGRAPKAKLLIQNGHWFKDHLLALDSKLDQLWKSYRKWNSLAVFTGIAEVCLELVATDNVYVTRTDTGGIYVAVRGG